MLDDWPRIKRLLDEALARDGGERAAYLADACGSDLVLRQRLDALLASADRTATFLETPAVSVLALPNTADDLSGAAAGTYRLIRRIGAGAMGEVYLAHDSKLDRRVAIKLIAQHLADDEDRLRRFRHEARAVSTLNHPNIVVMHDFGELNGRPFIVTEFVEGETVRERLVRGALAVSEAIEIASQVANALAAAHAHELIHRDIKPENVMVRPDGYVKVLDFGLAKLVRADRFAASALTFLTQPGHPAGTPYYMSPEQTRGFEVDASSDTWSLGVLLYEMIAGRPPFEGGTPADVLAAVLTKEPARLEAPDPMLALLRKALQKERSARYAEASVMAADLVALRKALDAARAHPPVSRDDDTALPAAGERCRGTVLISKLSDYEALIESIAPAEIDRIVSEIREAAADVVRRHGGIVNQAIGEEVVSLFGVPTAHEDDALRAVRAALELRTRARAIGDAVAGSAAFRVSLQSGLHAGAIVAQPLRGGPRRYAVAGSPIEFAARLASAAEADAILVSPELQRLLAPFLRTEPRPTIVVHASGQPVTPHAVIGESGLDSRLALADRVGLTPYTGRRDEFGALSAVVEQARRGEGRLVAIIGEAGSGKSRMLHELRAQVGSHVRVVQGRCRSQGGIAAYLPFVQALRSVLGVVEYAASEPTVDELVARIRGVDPSLEPFIPLYLHLLSRQSEEFAVPRHLRGEHFSAAMYDALAAIFTSYAQQSPTLLLLEDWHWADDASRDALRQIVEIVASYPLAIVVTSRPEHGVIEALPEPKTRINLAPLDAAASLAIAEALLGSDRVPQDLGRRLHDRTGGNPFFLEEMCHALREGGVVADSGSALATRGGGAVDLPDSVQAVIRSRIDRLTPDAREVLRVAAVIGREFTRRVLADVMGGRDLTGALERLKIAGLIQQTRVIPDAIYRFKHVLTQEVAYDSLLEHQRRTLHRAAGSALERLYADGGDQPLELLAYHFGCAEAWPEAIAYGERAADRATTLSQFADALAMLEQVQSWLMRLEDTSERRNRLADVLLKQERACETLGLRNRQQQLSADLIALLAPHGGSARLGEAYLRQGDVSTLLKRFDVADRALATALRISRERDDAALERSALRSIGLLRWHEGRHDEAIAINESALAIDRERGDDLAVAGDLSNLATVLFSMGELDRALAALEEALSMPAVADDPIKRLYINHRVANVYRARGDLTRALDYLQRSDDYARLHMLPIQRSFHLTTIAHIHLQVGRLEESLRLYQEAIQLSRRARHADGLAQSLRTLGELLFMLGRDDEALPVLQEAAQLFGQLQDEQNEAVMWQHVAVVHERTDHPDVMASWERARDRAEAAHDPAAELDAAEGMARVARRQSPDAAIARYEEALALAIRMGDERRQAALLNTLGILQWERGRYGDALTWYESALALARRLGDRRHEGLTLNSIGLTLARLHRDEEARTALEDALAVNRQSGNRLLEAHSLATLGDIARTHGRTDAAIQYFETSLEIRRAVGDRRGEAWMLQRLAATRDDLHDVGCSRQLLETARRIAAGIDDPALRRTLGLSDTDSAPSTETED